MIRNLIAYKLSIRFLIIPSVPRRPSDSQTFRRHRNSRLYRSLGRLLRAYNRRLVDELHARGFDDYSPAFPVLLSNLDTSGSHIGTLARRAGVTRQAAGQLLAQIERCGYVELKASPHDTRATMVRFTARGRRMLAVVIELIEAIDKEWAALIGEKAFEQAQHALFTVAESADPGGALDEQA